MAAFLPDAWIVDAIIALVAIEAVVLVLWRALTGGGLPVAETLANLSSGAALLLALRMALTGGLVNLCSGLAVGCARRSCRRSREPMGSGVGAPSQRGLVRCVTAGFVRHGLEDRLKAMKVLASSLSRTISDGSPAARRFYSGAVRADGSASRATLRSRSQIPPRLYFLTRACVRRRALSEPICERLAQKLKPISTAFKSNPQRPMSHLVYSS